MPRSHLFSRREFLAGTAAAAVATAWGISGRLAVAADEDRVSFFAVADTHYLANKFDPEQVDDRSRSITSRLIETLNGLPGAAISENAGGGVVSTPRGVIHAGDIIDTGDKNGVWQERMQQTEWKAFEADYGLNGGDGRLKYPVFEVHGNHDGPQGQGVAIDGIKNRNKRRAGLANVSSNGLHYSWNWGPVHFVNLGIVVGEDKRVETKRRYASLDSLDFLVANLKEHVGDSGRPVVITHHIDIARYTGPCDPANPENQNREWHPCDVRAFYEAILKFNVLAILYGHTHTRNIATWNGVSTRADEGFSLFNIDNSGHFGGGQQAFYYFEIGPEEMTVRECATKDGWMSHAWTPQLWKRPVAPTS